MNKPVMIVKTPEGTMIVKAAGKGAPKDLVDYMNKNGLKAIIMRSAAKHTGSLGGVGGERFNNFDRTALENGQWNHSGDLVKGSFKDSDIRINMGTFVDPGMMSAKKKQRIVRQLLSNLNNKHAPGVMQIVWDRVFEPNINGKDTLNTEVRRHLTEKTDIKELEKYMKDNKVDVDDIGVDIVHEIFTKHGHTKLAQKLARQIGKQDKKGELEDVDTFSPEEYKQYVYRNNRILDASDFAQSQREAGPIARAFWERVYKKYLLNRMYSPKYKHSTKAWLSPKDPVSLINNNIEYGNFKLDKGQGKMKVMYKGEETTLEKAWKKSGENPNDPDMEMLVIRVPSDSMSGTRVLKFSGFTGEKGFSITTNAKDNAYLGGADKDSDSVFIYQNMPKEMHKATQKQHDQWETKDGVLLDSKRERNDKLFGVDPEESAKYNTTTSKYSPSLRRRVAETASKGQQGLGLGIIAKGNLTSIADLIVSKGGKLTGLPVYNKDGEMYAKIDLELRPGGYERLIELGREIVNRSADASNYPTMVDFSKFPDILLSEAFITKGKTKLVSKKTGKVWKTVDLTYSQVRGSKLGDIAKVVGSINPQAGDRVSWNQLQNTIKNADVKDFDSFASFVARKMQDFKITDSVFEETMLTNYADLLIHVKKHIEGKQGIPDSIIKDLNQLLDYRINPKNIIEALQKGNNYENVRYMLEKDIESVAAFTAITEKGFEIYNAIDRLPLSKKQKASIVNKILKPIAEEASRIKRATRNNNPNRSQGKDMTHSSSELFDRQVINYKNGRLALHSAKINNWLKKNGHDIRFSQELLNDYMDLWLLSPFYRNTAKPSETHFIVI